MDFDVTIDHIARDSGKLKAFATVTFDGMFRVHGIQLAESKQGLNIFMPQRTFFTPSQPGRAVRSRRQSSTPTRRR